MSPTNVVSNGLDRGLVLPNNPTSSLPNNLSSNVSSGQNLLNQLQQHTAPQQQSSGGLVGDLQRLAPTIGSIALPTIADLLTGGLAAPADIALAGIGGGLGQGIENATKGQNPLQMNDLTSAGLGAAGQGAGELLGVGMKAAGGALSKAATDAATQASTDAAAQSAADETTRIGNEFSAVNPKEASVGPALEKAKSLGIQNPTAQDLSNLGSIYTYGNQSGSGVLDAIKSRALEQAGGTVDLSGTMGDLHSTLADPANQSLLGSEEPVSSTRGQLPKAPNNIATKIVQQVRNMLPGDTIDETGQLSQSLSPTEADSLRKAVGNQINITSPGSPLAASYETKLAENNIWKSVYRNISKAIYDRPAVDSVISNMSVGPDEEAMIEDAINKSGITDPNVQANIKQDLTNTINNAQKGQDILSAESPMVDVKNVGDLQTNEITNNPQSAASQKYFKSVLGGSSTAQSSGGTLNNLLSKLNLKNGSELGGLYETLSNHPVLGMPMMALGGIVGNPNAMGIGGDILSRLGGNAATDSLTNTALATLPGALGATIGMSPTTIPQGGTGVNTNMNGTLQNSLLAQLLRQDLSASNEALNGVTTPGISSDISQLPTLLDVATKAVAAQKAVEAMGNTAALSGVGQGPIMGILDQLGQTLTGGPASLFSNNLNQQEMQASKALQAAGVTPSPMPTPEQSKSAAQLSLNNVRGILESLGGGSASQYIPNLY